VKAIAPEQLWTARLRCDRLEPEHDSEIAGLVLDPRVSRTLWPWSSPPTEEDVRSGLGGQVAHWELHGFGPWLLRDRFTGEFVGRGGLQYTDASGQREVEVAWAIVPERWGEGLATELARTSVDVGFHALGVPELIALTLYDNLASTRVMEKAGFAYDREIEHAGLPHVLYRRAPERLMGI
jgi:ribosomal-protein-alanine N-acetyltransferase